MDGETQIKQQAMRSMKWSSLTTIVLRGLMPLNYMILARILTPASFGVATTIAMLVSFADILTDSGFQLYIIQHEFMDEEQQKIHTNAAYWANLVISLLLCLLMVIFRNQIAIWAGITGLGHLIAFASVQLPLNAIFSIQMAICRRAFSFHTIFAVRATAAIIPLVVSIPLALWGYQYWSLVAATISGQVLAAILMVCLSRWKPSLSFSWTALKDMLSFSSWSFLEAGAIWFCGWSDILLIGAYLSAYDLGLYKTSLNLVNALAAVIASAITPVLFAALSRFQQEQHIFKKVFQRTQSMLAYVMFPMGVGLFLYQDLATRIMFGTKWQEAGFIIGIWSLTTAIKVVFSDLGSECIRALGKPRLSFMLHAKHVCILIPAVLLGISLGFRQLVYIRALIRLELAVSCGKVIKQLTDISWKEMLKQVRKPAILSLAMLVFALGLKQISNHIWWQIFSILLCVVFYGSLVLRFGKDDVQWVVQQCFPKLRQQTKGGI